MEMFLVGGFVRDHIMGVRSKDADFSCIAPSFEDMQRSLEEQGFEIFVSTPEFFTLRARGPKGFKFADHDFGTHTFDFVWARKDGTYSDNRRPDFVTPGTLHDDLARRDFSCNAIARDSDGTLIDPFHGVQDIRNGVIRAVGNPVERFTEDPLRIMRALRFAVTKNFTIEIATSMAMDDTMYLLKNVSAERVREELSRMFNHNPLLTVNTLNDWELWSVLIEMGLNFQPTMKERVK